MSANHTAILPDRWKSVVIHTLDQLESIRPIWQKMQAEEPCPVINADIERYLSVLRALEGEAHPLIVLLTQNGQPRAMVIGRREERVTPVRMGYKTLIRPKLRCMTVVYGGVLGQPDEQVSSFLICELMKVLRKRKVHVISFNHLKIDSSFYRQVRKIPNILCRNHFPRLEPHWRMAIPQTIDEFLVSCPKSFRKHLRRYCRKMESDNPQGMHMRTFSLPDNLSKAIADASRISENTYQNALGVGLEDCEQTRRLLHDAALMGWFRGHILYIYGEPVAYRFAQKYGRVYYGDGIGYDLEWRDYNVGTLSLLKVLEIICQDCSIDYYDFGFGDALWKRQTPNTESWQEAVATYLFAPRLYPLVINAMIGLNSAFTLCVKCFLHRIRVFDWVKRVWRGELKKTVMRNRREDKR